MSRRVGVCPRRKDHLRVGRLPSAQGRRKNHGTPLDAVLDLNKRAERGAYSALVALGRHGARVLPTQRQGRAWHDVSGLPPRPPCGHQQNGRTPRTTQDMYAMPSAFGSNRACPPRRRSTPSTRGHGRPSDCSAACGIARTRCRPTSARRSMCRRGRATRRRRRGSWPSASRRRRIAEQARGSGPRPPRLPEGQNEPTTQTVGRRVNAPGPALGGVVLMHFSAYACGQWAV